MESLDSELKKMKNVKDPKVLIQLLENLKNVAQKKGNDLYDAGKYAEAVIEYKKILPLYSGATEIISNTDNKDLGFLLPTLNDNVKFWKDYVREIEEDAKKEESSTLRNESNKLQQMGDYTGALRLIDSALEKVKSSDKPAILNDKGNLFFNKQEYYNAIKFYDYAIKLDDKFYTAIANKALSFHNLKKFDEAIRFYKEALAIKADNFDCLLNLGGCYYEVELYDEAKKYFDEAYELEPKNFVAILSKATGIVGVGEYQESIPYFQDAIKIDPTSINAHIGLAEAYLITKQYKLCEQKVQEIIDISIEPSSKFLARLFLNCCQHRSNAKDANEVSSQLLNDLNDSFYPLFWDLFDIRKFVSTSNEFSSSQQSIILLLIDAFDHEEEREEAKNTIRKLTMSERPNILRKIVPETKRTFNIKINVKPSKMVPWYYDWDIFLDEPTQNLKHVSLVTYVLHPTFPKPIQKITNKTTKFGLKGRCRGSFQIKVKVYLKNNNHPITQYKWLMITPTLT